MSVPLAQQERVMSRQQPLMIQGGESNFQQESGATTTDQVDDSITADERFQSRPDHSEGSQEPKRRKFLINVGIRLLLRQTKT